MAFWVKPDTVTEEFCGIIRTPKMSAQRLLVNSCLAQDAYFISRHLVSGSNVLMLLGCMLQLVHDVRQMRKMDVFGLLSFRNVGCMLLRSSRGCGDRAS